MAPILDFQHGNALYSPSVFCKPIVCRAPSFLPLLLLLIRIELLAQVFFMMDYVILLLVLYVHSRYYWRIRLYFRVVLYPESAMKGVFEASRENRAFLHSFAQFRAQIFQKFDKKMNKSLIQLSLETHFPMIELTGFGFYPTPSLSNSSSRFSFKFINLLHLWTLGCTKINEIHSPLCDFQNQIVSGFFSLNFL